MNTNITSPTTDKQNVHIQPIHSTFWEFRADNALLLKMKTFIDKNKSMKTRLQQLSCYVPFTVHKAHLLIFNKNAAVSKNTLFNGYFVYMFLAKWESSPAFTYQCTQYKGQSSPINIHLTRPLVTWTLKIQDKLK